MRLNIFSCAGLLTLFLLATGMAFGQTASFTATPTTGCAPLVVNFTNTSTGTGLTYQWDFGNGITSVLKNPSTVYLTAGSYTVKLRIKDANGNEDSVTHTNLIVASSPPSVDFYSPDTSSLVCGVKTATFYNTTALNATGGGSYKWDFGTGTNVTTNSTASQTHTYSVCGNYSVTLIATNSAGCVASLTKTQYIKVPCKPVAAFTSTNNIGCGAPYTVNFNAAASSNATSYTWNFGDGSPLSTTSVPATTHSYAATGTYTVTLVATSANGCTDTLVRPGYVVIKKTTAQLTANPTTACVGAPVSFTNSATPAGGTFTWFFKWPSNAAADKSTAPNPNYTYTAAGTYTVKLVYLANGCRDTATTTITVNPKPVVAFSGTPLTACSAPLNVNFSNTSTGATSYTWLFGDASTSTLATPSHTYTATGNYNVSLVAISAAGCRDTLTKPNYVKIQQPTAVINGPQDLGCAPAANTFTLNVTSVTGSTSGYSYTWNWGDGTPNTTTGSTAASHTYTTAGTRTITVTGTGPGGCTFTATKTVVVGTKPDATFNASPLNVCYGNSISFTNTTTDATSYIWYFGDGGTSTLTNVTRSYNNPGTFTVMLVASNAGCTDTAYQTVVVKEPKANFSASLQNCSDRFTICFNNTSVSSGPTLYEWDFGVAGINTDTSTEVSPCYTFPAYGTYTVKLKVTNLTTGCTNTRTANIKVYELAAQLASADTSVCAGQTANFQAQTDPNFNQYSWNWGDGSAWETGTPAAAASTGHIYTTPGTYTLKLAVRDVYNCWDTITFTNLVKVKGLTPGFTATPNSGCKPLTVLFTDTATPVLTTITNHTWYFGDSPVGQNTGTTNSVSHTYLTPATSFTVKLVYTMAGGCKDSITIPNMVNTNGPAANFTIAPDTNVCSGAPVTLTNTSTAGAASYLWLFPNGTTSSSTTPPPYVTTGSGLQQIRLIAIIPGVCRDTMTKNIFVHKATANFAMSDSAANCPPLTVNFTNLSHGVPPASALTYAWDFGNGASSESASPTTIYNTAGVFTPRLIVTSAFGCKDTLSKTITINTGATATLNYSAVSGCAPQSACFSITNIINATNLTLDFQDGSTYSAALSGADTTVCHSFTNGGIFKPVLIMSNIGTGCFSIVNDPDTIKIGEPTAGFMATPNPVCQYGTVSFTDTSSSNGIPIIAWNWNFGDPASGAANTSVVKDPTHTFLTTGVRTVRLIVTDATGCNDTIQRTITVNPAPPVNAGADVTICVGAGITLNATGADTYAWGPASSGLSCYNCASPVASPTITTTYWVAGTNTTTGCTLTDSIKVTVAPLPQAPVVASPITYCQNDAAVPLTATGSTPGNTLNWYASLSGPVLPGAPTPSTATPGAFTWYVSQTTDAAAGGCEGPKVAVTVNVNPLPTAPPATSPVNYCQGATAVPLTATAGAGYTLLWYTVPGPGGTGSTTAPTPATASAGTFTYYVSRKDNTTNCESPRTAISVIVSPLPAAPVAPDVTYCQLATAAPLTATATPGNTLKWYTSGMTVLPGAPTPATTTVGTTTYYVSQVNTATGCEGARTMVTVTITTTPNVTVTPNQNICMGSSVALTATGASTYSWSPANGLSGTTGATVTANPATTTTYQVIGSLGGACADTAQVTVTVVPKPTVSVTPATATICDGSSTVLTASGATSYIWQPTTGLTPATGATVTATPTVSTTYQVIGSTTTAGFTCSDTATTHITVNPKPTITISGNTTICSGGSTTLTASGASAYTWSPAIGLSAATGAVVTANPTTTRTYTVTGTDINGCANSTTVTVTVNSLPVVNATANATDVCPGTTVTLSTPAASGVTYSWSPAITCTGSCNTGTATVYTNTTFTVTATNAAGCTANSSVTVNTWTPPTVTATTSVPAICPGDTAQLTASGAATYIWSPNAGLTNPAINNPKAFPLTTTAYSVIGTDVHGCKDTATVNITVNTPPTVSAGANVAICTGSSAMLNATGAATYVWSPAAGLSSTTIPNPVASPATTTTYTVIGTAANGCKDTATVTVTVQSQPPVNAGPDTSVCLGFGVQLQATGTSGMTFTWSPAAGLSSTTIPNPVASPATTTTYVVTGVDAFGCSGKDTVVVTVWTPPTVTATTSVPAICPGDTAQLTAGGATTYIWSPATSLTGTAIANPKAFPLTTTTYSVIGTDVHGCKDTATVNIAVNTPPTVSAGANVTICAGSSATLNATGATSYIWSPATGLSGTTGTTVTANPATTTTYTVIGTAANGCKDTATVTVTVQPLPVINAGLDTSVCLGFGVQLQATPTAGLTYVWTPAAGLSSTTVANPIASPAATTSYIVTGTDAFGCSGKDTVVVTVWTPPTVTATNSTTAICPGDSTQLTATGALNYVWSPATALSSTTIANPKAFPLTTTTYSVIGTDVHGCKDTATISVTVNTPPTVTVTPNVNICTGGNVTLTASGASTYSWSPATGLSGVTGATLIANPATTTTYTVIGTAANGCKDTATVTVTVQPLPVINAGLDTSVCLGFGVQLQATPTAGLTYVWTPAAGLSSTTVANPIASPAATTSYIVTGTDAFGCSGKDTVVVTVWTPPTVTATNSTTAICPGDSTQLTATGALNYVWSPATALSSTTIANPKAFPLTTTTYSVIGTDVHGCKDTATISVTVNTPPTVTVTPNVNICTGGNVTLTASGASTYSWSPATGLSGVTGATLIANPATTTTYTVIGTAANGCKDTATVTVTVQPLPVINAGLDTSVCLGFGVQLQATPTAGLTYVWTPAAGLSSTTVANPIASPAATTSYIVTGTDAFGCSGKDTVVVTVWTPPTVTATTSVPAICPGDTAQLTAGGATTYIWSPATSLTGTAIANPKAFPLTTTTYSVIGTDVHGCKDTATVNVVVNTPPTVSAGGNYDVCVGGSVTLNATGAATYVWSPATGLSSTTIANPIASPIDTIVYTVIGTASNGCKDTATATVFTHPLPIINAGVDTSVCPGFGVQLQATPTAGLTFAWSPAASLSAANIANPIATPAVATTYTVTATDAFGCIGSDQITVSMRPVPVVSVSATSDSVCKWGAVTLTGTGALNYSWQPGNSMSSSITVRPTATTTYTVIGTNASGCKDTAAMEVGVYQELVITTSPDVTICEGASTELIAAGASTYVWTPSETLSSPTGSATLAMPDTSTVYTVIATDQNGCKDTASVRVLVIPLQPMEAGPGGTICKGGEIRLSASGGSSYSWFPATGLSNPNIANPLAKPETTTTYTVTITQGNCFVETFGVTVEVNPTAEIQMASVDTLMAGATLQLSPLYQNVDNFLWTPADGLSCTDCASPIATPARTTTYTLYATNSYGCNDTSSITVVVLCDGSEIWLPNTFTPNGDGNNDRFYPRGKGVTVIESFRIYNRWGETVYDAHNIPVDDIRYSWDGTYKGKLLSPDVFMYVITASCGSGEAIQIKGDITLMR